MIAHLDKQFLKLRPTKFWARIVAYIFFEGRPATTRGQWINTFIFGLFKCINVLPVERKSIAPVFIIGMGRSGTTALGAVLSIHKELSYLNEPKALWYFANDMDDLIGSYSNKPGRYCLTEKDASADTIKKAHKIYNAFSLITGKKRVLDKYPEMLFRMSYAKQIFPDAKFIFIARNGVDNCHSVEKWCSDHSMTVGDGSHDWWGVNSRKWNLLVEQVAGKHPDLANKLDKLAELESDRDRAALEWILTMREGLMALQQYPNDVIKVHYEELCNDSDSAMNRLYDFINVGYDAVSYEYSRSKFSRKSKPGHDITVNASISVEFKQAMTALGYLEAPADSEVN